MRGVSVAHAGMDTDVSRRMSFSQALALLEQRGIAVEHLGRLARYGCLMWRVNGKELNKEGVIDYAMQLAQEGQQT